MDKQIVDQSIAIHNYDAINWDIVHNIVDLHLKDFSEFAKAVVAWRENNQV